MIGKVCNSNYNCSISLLATTCERPLCTKSKQKRLTWPTAIGTKSGHLSGAEASDWLMFPCLTTISAV